MGLRPWFHVVQPREDIRGKTAFDLSQFAVHLDEVCKGDKGNAPDIYKNPEKFFAYTYLTRNILELSAEVIRRLSGDSSVSPIFNLATQFGGGKTHTLTLLYHLARGGKNAKQWMGVHRILEKAGITTVPEAKIAIFVGQEFDTRGGDDGTPVRQTPWGEIAWQLGGLEGFRLFESFDRELRSPGGETIGKLIDQVNRPILIMMDEIINYTSRYRDKGLGDQLYNFIQNLSEKTRNRHRVVFAVSIPKSEMEMTPADQADHERFKKMLNRLGKAVIMSTEEETSEIIRRRLFDWSSHRIFPDGKIDLLDDARQTCKAYAEWIRENKKLLPHLFPLENAQEIFESTYPFHPLLISVFERKWQVLPRFQQTRGILHMLSLWVSRAYEKGMMENQKDSLISLGLAPLSDPNFRSAVFEQLGENKLEGAVTTDIAGRKDSHAVLLDEETIETVGKTRLHRKTATVIFFESNGGQSNKMANLSEVRLAVGEPNLDIANVDTVIDTLQASCYYLKVKGNDYYFSLTENLNKRFVKRRVTIPDTDIDERMRSEIEKEFRTGTSIKPVFFPRKSSQITDYPALTVVVLSPEDYVIKQGGKVMVPAHVETMTKEYGDSSRRFKNGLIWVIADPDSKIGEEARNLLAWEGIQDDLQTEELPHPDAKAERQRLIQQLSTHISKAKLNMKRAIWQSYKYAAVWDNDQRLKVLDPLGEFDYSSSKSIVETILSSLMYRGEVETDISPTRLVENWGAFDEWSTADVRDAIYASTKFARLRDANALKRTIVKGVTNGYLAYVGKTADGLYDPFYFRHEGCRHDLSENQVEISADMYIIKPEEAKKHIEPPKLTKLIISPSSVTLKTSTKQSFKVVGYDQYEKPISIPKVNWSATGGSISNSGVFTAGPDEGNFFVTATLEQIEIDAQVHIVKDEIKPPPSPTPPPTETESVYWSGKVSNQKWTNFYMRVLSRFAVDHELDIEVNLKIHREGGVSKPKIEEMKAALRDLGLDDEVGES